ncbi:MAG: hypothetical protein M5R40_07890 [Anaerolineae bacterium]|nr:hypothetical protein [Anaerolineae bacterium]
MDVVEKHVATRAEPRTTSQVTFVEQDLVLEAPVGTPLEEFIRAAEPLNARPMDAPIVAAIVDGQLRELTYPMTRDVVVRPVTLRDSDGMRLYRRSLVFLLATAARELFPGHEIVVEHALPNGGFLLHGDRARAVLGG